MTDENISGLSAAEDAYFESGGEAALPDDLGTKAETQPEAAVVEKEQARDDSGRFAKQTTVPHAVFHAEREDHKRTKAELDELRQYKARIDERNSWVEEQKKAKEEPPPDPETDIFGYAKWLAGQSAKDRQEIQELREAASRRQQQEQEFQQSQQVETAIWSVWEDAARGFAAQQADFPDAAKFLAEARDKQLEAYAAVDPRFANKAARDAAMNAELREIVINARRNNVSPAQAVYNIAKSYGYQGGQQQPIQMSDKLRGVQAAQQAARTVAAAPGRASGGELTMEAILAMERPEFDAWYAEPKNARYYDRLIGG